MARRRPAQKETGRIGTDSDRARRALELDRAFRDLGLSPAQAVKIQKGDEVSGISEETIRKAKEAISRHQPKC